MNLDTSPRWTRSIRRICSLTVGILALEVAPFAQPQSTGSIEGRVQNAVTGRYLNNARVSVKGTPIQTLTDDSGHYRLTRVPPGGAIVLEVYYTGLDPQEISINVPQGISVTRDVSMTNAALYGALGSAVQLDPFTVEASKETDSATIAINDQRFAPNIKNIVSTDSLGDVAGGSIGEFLKYIPGLDTGGAAYGNESVSIRGFDANRILVTTDGAPTANSGGRGFTFEQASINNYSRVEITKVPTPATPADSISGSVNLVIKSSFERNSPEFRYHVNLTASRRDIKLGKQPRADEEFTHMLKPSANFSLIYPITKDFGLTFSGLHYMVNVPYNSPIRTYNGTAANTGATYANPYLQQINTQITTQFRTRDSASVKLDWRPAQHSVLSASYTPSYYNLDSMNYNFMGNAGTNPNPTVSGGTRLSFGPDFTVGATGRGTIGQSAGFNTRHQWLSSGNVTYRFDNGDWKADALFSASKGKSWTTQEDGGFFGGFTTSAKVPVRISFIHIDEIGPANAEVYTDTDKRFDIYDINNYNITGVSGGRRELVENMVAGHLNVKRRIDALAFPASLQLGWAGRTRRRDLQSFSSSYTYNPVDGDRSASAFRAVVYANIKEPLMTGIERNPPPGKGVPYSSPHLAFEAWKRNPNLFSMTPAQVVSMETGRRNNSQYFEEGVDAFYAQGEMRLFDGRLNALAGVRYERTTNYGEGLLNDPAAVWMRNPDGSFARNSAGARIRRPEAGSPNSLEELNLTRIERGSTAKRSTDGYFPSLHFTYNFTERLLVRAAYAKTYGRPDYAELIPNTVVNENDLGDEPDPNAVLGTLQVRNTGLRPWTADNYDLSVEYYTDEGGLFGAAIFHKEIKDFFGTLSKVASAEDIASMGLDPAYVGWQINTRINAGDAQVRGFEANASHSLNRLGRWGRNFKAFANFTKIVTKGEQEANFSGFLPTAINWGLTYSRRPLIVVARWHKRSDVQSGPFAAFGPGAYTYIKGRVQLDLNLSYQLRRNASLFLGVRNATNERIDYLRIGPDTPDYAIMGQPRNYGGATIDFGVKGSF